MKRPFMGTLILRLLLGLVLFASSSFVVFGSPQSAQARTTQQTDKQEQVVYITKTGKKYHRSWCRYLKHSKIEVSRSEAVANGYTPCKVCRP